MRHLIAIMLTIFTTAILMPTGIANAVEPLTATPTPTPVTEDANPVSYIPMLFLVILIIAALVASIIYAGYISKKRRSAGLTEPSDL